MDSKARIFMVDDDADLVNVVSWVLEAKGYEVRAANSAEQAIGMIDQVNPDLMILDVMMEDVVAGFRVVNHLRGAAEGEAPGKYAKLPILMMTSIQQRTKMKFSQDAGSRLLPIDAFLEKPVKPQVLLETVERLLAARGARPVRRGAPAHPGGRRAGRGDPTRPRHAGRRGAAGARSARAGAGTPGP